MDDRRRQGLGRLRQFTWVLSLVGLVFVGKWLWQLDRQVWTQIWELQPGFLGLATVLFVGWFIARYFAWHMISKNHGIQHGLGQNMRMWALSEIMRYIPGGLWSYVGRWRGAVAGGVQSAGAVQSVLIEALGLVGGAVALAIVMLQPDWQWWGWAGLGSYVIVAPLTVKKISQKFNISQTKPVTRHELVWLVFLYAGSWLLFGLAHAAILYSFPNPPIVPNVQLVGFSVLAWLLGYISLTPMGLGVREVVLVGLLQSAGVSLGVASLMTITSRLWLIVSELIFVGAVVVWSRRKS